MRDLGGEVRICFGYHPFTLWSPETQLSLQASSKEVCAVSSAEASLGKNPYGQYLHVQAGRVPSAAPRLSYVPGGHGSQAPVDNRVLCPGVEHSAEDDRVLQRKRRRRRTEGILSDAVGLR